MNRVNIFPPKSQHLRKFLFAEKALVAAAVLALYFTLSAPACLAGGSEVYESMTLGADRKCTYALSPQFPIKRGTPCTINVSFGYTGFQGKRARGVSYWIEAAPPGSERFRRISRVHVYDVFGKPEHIKVMLPKTSRIMVVFNTGGDPNFGEYYDDSVTIRSREPAICRIAAPGQCSFSEYDKTYNVFIEDSTIHVSNQ